MLKKEKAMQKFSQAQWGFLLEYLKIAESYSSGAFEEDNHFTWEDELYPIAQPYPSQGNWLLQCTHDQKYCLGEKNWEEYLKLPGKTWLMNAIFNTLFPKFAVGRSHLLVKKTKEEFGDILLKKEFDSAIGYESTAKILQQLFGVDCHPGFEMVKGEKKLNRKDLDLNSPNDTYLAAIVRPDYRLPEGNLWTPEQLEAMELDYYVIVPSRFIS